MKHFLRHYYLAAFFYDCVFAYAIYNLLFNIRGLSVFQISLLLAWWALAAILLEIPSGALADYWSRQKMLTLAPLIKSLCFVTWFFAHGDFYLYALGFLFWALGSSLVSGTTEALLYDTLTHFGRAGEYEKALGKKKLYYHAGLAISMISGGFIASYNLDWAVIFSVAPLLLSALFAALIKEVPKVESTKEMHYLEYLRLGIAEVKTNRVLLYLFVYLLAISVFGNLEEFDQLYYRLAGLPIFAFGLVGFLWSALNAVGAYYAHRLKDRPAIYYLLPFASAFCLVFVASHPSIPMIGLLLLSYAITSPLMVLTESSIQRSIQSISRATVTSAGNLLVYLFGVLQTLLFGLVSQIWNLPAIYLTAAIFLLALACWAFLVRDRVALRTAGA